jgi:hypothetical protein
MPFGNIMTKVRVTPVTEYSSFKWDSDTFHGRNFRATQISGAVHWQAVTNWRVDPRLRRRFLSNRLQGPAATCVCCRVS